MRGPCAAVDGHCGRFGGLLQMVIRLGTVRTGPRRTGARNRRILERVGCWRFRASAECYTIRVSLEGLLAGEGRAEADHGSGVHRKAS